MAFNQRKHRTNEVLQPQIGKKSFQSELVHIPLMSWLKLEFNLATQYLKNNNNMQQN